jgi:alpha-galactosidase
MKKNLFTALTFLSVFTCFAQQTIELNNWKFKTGDNLEWASPNYNDSEWNPIQAGNEWQSQG